MMINVKTHTKHGTLKKESNSMISNHNKRPVQVGIQVYIKNKPFEVAEILSKTSSGVSGPGEADRPFISVYRLHHGKALKQSVFYVGDEYELKQTSAA